MEDDLQYDGVMCNDAAAFRVLPLSSLARCLHRLGGTIQVHAGWLQSVLCHIEEQKHETRIPTEFIERASAFRSALVTPTGAISHTLSLAMQDVGPTLDAVVIQPGRDLLANRSDEHAELQLRNAIRVLYWMASRNFAQLDAMANFAICIARISTRFLPEVLNSLDVLWSEGTDDATQIQRHVAVLQSCIAISDDAGASAPLHLAWDEIADPQHRAWLVPWEYPVPRAWAMELRHAVDNAHGIISAYYHQLEQGDKPKTLGSGKKNKKKYGDDPRKWKSGIKHELVRALYNKTKHNMSRVEIPKAEILDEVCRKFPKIDPLSLLKYVRQLKNFIVKEGPGAEFQILHGQAGHICLNMSALVEFHKLCRKLQLHSK